jgi:predicted DNA-binding ribbon-helix-helix protein
MPGKRVQFDDDTWLALDVLARDRMMSFQELADEAFNDLLKKHHRPADLKSALRQSAGIRAATHVASNKRKQRKRAKTSS